LIALNKNGCQDTSCQELILCDPLVFVPVNIFSPDGNGQNDEFTFYHRSDAVKEFYCTVVNRWGVIIAEFNNVNDGWNGTDKQGNKVPDGVYFYTYAGKADTGEEFSGQGTVTLVNGK
jgi:gliding motility-associated-like protein